MEKKQTSFMSRDVSVLLDVLRFCASVVVAIGHEQVRMVNVRHLVPESSGNASVCIFFVLSGFVIRFVTRSRVGTAAEYWIDRSSRIYSVVVPALALTVLFVAITKALGAGGPEVDTLAWSQVPAQMAESLTFTTGFWGYGPMPCLNGAFWSLTFECVYYVLYGLTCFRVRWGWALAALLLIVSGPSIAVMFLIWLFGAWLYDLYASLDRAKNGLAIALGALATYALTVFALRHQIANFLKVTAVDRRDAFVSAWVGHFALGQRLFHGQTLPWLSRLSVSFFLTGSALAIVLLAAMLILDRYVPPISKSAAKTIRLIADSTFTLYLVHLPFFMLFFALVGRPVDTWKVGAVALALAIGLSIVLAMVFDRLKNWMRAKLREMFVPPRVQVPASSAGV